MNRVVVMSTALLAASLSGCGAAASAQEEGTHYVRYEQGGAISWGILEGATIHELSDAPYLAGARTGRSVAVSDVTLRAPVAPKVVATVDVNFHGGAEEPREQPSIILLPPVSVVGPDAPVERPEDADNLHAEPVAAVVIGRRARDVPAEQAGEYIFGVTAGTDVTEATWRQRDTQWVRAKGSDTFNPMGPVLVRTSDVDDLVIVARHNGTEHLRLGAADMVFDFGELVSFVTRHMTLDPGDVIMWGATGRSVPVAPGDVYEVEIDGVGVLRNPVVQAPPILADWRGPGS